MQQIKDVYFSNLHIIAISLIIKNMQIKNNFTCLYIRLLALL